jgi:hypothetical protein
VTKDKRLTDPEHGKPIDTGGMPVTSEPVPGGVRTENLSVPGDHEARVVYRELSADEKTQAKKDQAASATFDRVDAIIFLRLTRDALLRATDYVDLPATEKRMKPAELKTWQTWRQQLRDLPAKTKNPAEPDWPKPPAVISALLEHRRLWPELTWGKLLEGGQ